MGRKTIAEDEIDRSLEQNNGRKKETADALGISIRSLRYRIQKSAYLKTKYSKLESLIDDGIDYNVDHYMLGEFLEYFKEHIETKPGYLFANDKKKAKIKELALEKFKTEYQPDQD